LGAEFKTIKSFVPVDRVAFFEKFEILKEFCLVTLHPETHILQDNVQYAQVMKNALATISKKIF
jgi:hypothetical protein